MASIASRLSCWCEWIVPVKLCRAWGLVTLCPRVMLDTSRRRWTSYLISLIRLRARFR